MINRQITYERDIHNSYMKIPPLQEYNYDEKLIFYRHIQGTIPVEKCYISEGMQYWYNISGKQALDAYCRVSGISYALFERLILRICEQIEILEWNLISSQCLMLDPELIFLGCKGEEIYFVLYPQKKGNPLTELRELTEFLLAKLDHSDPDGVKATYEIYERTLTEGCSIEELKHAILQSHIKETVTDRQLDAESESARMPKEIPLGVQLAKQTGRTSLNLEKKMQNAEQVRVDEWYHLILEKLSTLYEYVKKLLKSTPEELMKKKVDTKEVIPPVVYPEDIVEEPISKAERPTVCLSSLTGETKGLLIYEGLGNYPDYEVEKEVCIIGKSVGVGLSIERETVSGIHAKIDWTNGAYYIEDMNSTNGTYVNEEILSYKERKKLNTGDLIRFADVKYRFL